MPQPDDTPREQTSVNEYYILHVEDEPRYGDMIERNGHCEYEGPLKSLVGEALFYYGIDSDLIVWDLARNRQEAIQKLDNAERRRPDRPFDAVICDLKIPDSSGGKLHENNGFAVIEDVRSRSWRPTLIVVTNFSEDPDVLQVKERLLGNADRLDDFDFLGKTVELGSQNHDLAVAKLRRLLIPTEKYVDECKGFGGLFVNHDMKALLRQIVYWATRKYDRWPLAKFLLIGDAGCGKNVLAKTFAKLLPTLPAGARELESQGRLYVVNCAQRVAEGHGGLIDFLGAEGMRLGGGAVNQPGCFEFASCYRAGKNANGLATGSNPDPIYERAGVVLLDEFAELSPKLQTAILNALNEGVVHRQGSGRAVPIGCHIIFATNYKPSKFVGEPDELESKGPRARKDLSTRIADWFRVPSLAERIDEIEPLIKYIASQRAGADVTISQAASRMVLQMAVGRGIITSIRDLEMIASVEPGETVITDANLASVFRRADVLGISVTEPASETPFEEKAATLGLPEELRTGTVSDITREVVDLLFRRKIGEAPRDDTRHMRNRGELTSKEAEDRFIIISSLIPPEIIRAVYANPSGLRAARNRAYPRCKINTNCSQEELHKQIIDYLLHDPP